MVVPVSDQRGPRPLIGLPVANRIDRRGMRCLGVNATYVRGLQAAGADVALLAPGPAGAAPALLERLDGLLLPGGVDVAPARYGDSPRPGLGPVDEDLDALELPLVDAAIERRLPLFGICRGQQVVNVALGGTLYQDLTADGATDLEHSMTWDQGRDFLAHPIEIAGDSRLREIVGADRIEVNSFHHQAVRQVAPGLRVTAFSPADGVIEGLESDDGMILTIQCHPEELTMHAWARALFEEFVTTAADLSPRPTRS